MGSTQPLPPPPSQAPSPSSYAYPPIIIILTIILLIFFFFGFFAIYFCRCFMESILCTWHLRHGPSGAPAMGGPSSSTPAIIGLDPMIVQSFPTFTYSTVKEYRKEKYGLECAICLIEFQGSDVLRLLTTCYHVFHQECIDLWLESHKTCPACRRNLESPARSPLKSLSIGDNNETRDSISITIEDENEDHESERGSSSSSSEKGQRVCSGTGDEKEEEKGESSKVDKFSRSHSTGHSLIRNKEMEEDRFKLILPEHVTSDIIRAHHNPSQSCPSFGDIKDDQSGYKKY